MKLLVAVSCVALVALLLGSDAADGLKTTQASKTPCPRCDTVDYEPVCVRTGGTDKEPKLTTFGSECVLKTYNCEKGTTLSVKNKGECPKGSPVRLS